MYPLSRQTVVIPEVVIGNPVLYVNGWVPDNDFGNDDLATLTYILKLAPVKGFNPGTSR